MNQSDQLYIDHEVRIRVNEEIYKDLRDLRVESKESWKELKQEMNSQFRWTVTMFFTILLANIALFGSVFLIKAS
jgi:CRISPR/Cas system CSM-associated protein Csm5 (group 7 of RAMP superfamily)